MTELKEDLDLYPVYKIAKLLKVSSSKINELLKEAKKDFVPCYIIAGQRIKIFKNEFLNYIKRKSLEVDICQKKKDFIKEEDFGGFHTPKKEYNSINQLKARLLMKQ